ncbi:MAG: FapA family protein [bacterium]|nr:FapA family protein [bacterium]
MISKNAYFALQIQSDGTYLKLYPAKDGGKPLTLDAVTAYFALIHFEDYDVTQLLNELKARKDTGIIKLTNNKIRPVDELLSVSIDSTEFEAVGRFYAPSNQGSSLTKEDIMDTLKGKRVQFGIDSNLIEKWVNNREYNKDFVLAAGADPVQGRNGAVQYCFDTNPNAQPRINEDGTVDYRQLDNIVHVKEGEKVACLVPAVPGKAGMTVTGKPIAPAKIKTPKLKVGRNLSLSEDGMSMYTNVSGHVYLVDDKVFVSNIYEVLGDVNASTGNIEYDGDIHVKGNVSSGYSLKATGQIIVEGVVEGSRLEADGPIIIMGGIQGMNKAYIKSQLNVTAKFIENATVEAGLHLLTETIMHSKVSAGGYVKVEGKRGLIIGGEVHAAESVTFKVAGSPMSAFTLIEVGLDPSVVTEYRTLDAEVKKEQQEFTQLTQILSTYRQKLATGLKLNPSQVQTVRQIGARVKELEAIVPEKKERREELGEYILKSNRGKVIVQDKVYPRVKIVISNAILIIKNETHYCAFVKDGEDVCSKPL